MDFSGALRDLRSGVISDYEEVEMLFELFSYLRAWCAQLRILCSEFR
jgi:hypothetical protein